MKKCLTACTSYIENPADESKANIQVSINEAFSKIDKAVKRGVLHRNNGAHKKSQLNSAFKHALDGSSAK